MPGRFAKRSNDRGCVSFHPRASNSRIFEARTVFVKEQYAKGAGKPIESGGLSMEYGIIIPQGIDHSMKRIPEIIEDELAKLRLEPIFSTALVY
uniref:Uncharacterized protein n=1 Tax=Candidatus Kentrum sp. TC TaxID=2126339 RepID=A0A450YEN0_9GAMM|nr:MAG: hypothetical protein BECKTC1821D_GA0114238_100825 [Candidatus Kentron sp. TC]VFK56616.1 MAG: hypothetical protein BECKTC1821F_GA0114240_101124 [Candidatus Kentron sp. TC]